MRSSFVASSLFALATSFCGLFAARPALAAVATAADGLGPGGYAAIGWIILTVFVVGFLTIVGVIALVAWLILRRRHRSA